ncbi:DedA family protein [Xylanimonas oleitrophica]|uniref:DedA family protein n=1 Tax=Xylanimonas oleitrophica TaxID=2607479 RepID=A0A2W5WVG6_9MICO|nr:VTT domain-containing protein [Xylanimonas oleitrophica]PZR55297.1 DedA family protein [Xylanimonas oleitrophica]
MDALNAFVLDAAAGPWALGVLFLTAVVDGVLPPVPSEGVLVALAAVSAAGGGPPLALLVAVAGAGAWIGDNLAFLTGRWLGRRPAAGHPRLAAAVARAALALERRGGSVVLTARFVPVGRVAVSLAAGASGLAHRRFAALSALAALAWAVVTTAIGLWAGSWLGDQPLLAVVLAIAVGLLLGTAVDAVVRRARPVPADVLPVPGPQVEEDPDAGLVGAAPPPPRGP